SSCSARRASSASWVATVMVSVIKAFVVKAVRQLLRLRIFRSRMTGAQLAQRPSKGSTLTPSTLFPPLGLHNLVTKCYKTVRTAQSLEEARFTTIGVARTLRRGPVVGHEGR